MGREATPEIWWTCPRRSSARRGGDFGVALHGAQVDPAFQACADLGVTLVDVRHEASAGFVAEAFSRLTGALGVAVVCPGPGLTNALTSMTSALLDRTAVLYIVGSTSESTLETNGLQVGIDHVALARPITKWACKVHSVDQIGRIAAQAIRIATTAPRGPVLIDVPADVLEALAPGWTASTSPLGAAPAASAVDAMLERMAHAWRPVMLLEWHAERHAARVAFNDLLDVTGVPCFVEYGAIGVVGDDDDRYGGTLLQPGRLTRGSPA